MKKSVMMLMVASLLTAMPLVAAEEKKEAQIGKECVQRCVLQSETIQQKIARLKSSIEQGKKTYSEEELRKLEEKLNEANYMLDSINRP